MTHPYQTLPDHAFWRKAVSEKSPLQLTDVYKKKYEISPADVIATAGSCFAQHIARFLVKNGYNFHDFEPAPPLLRREDHSKFGYGVFSARYGNIYTVRQLLQTFRRAFDEFTPAVGHWHHKGRYFDSLRPAIEPNGFASLEELEASRRTHLRAVRQLFTQSDVFIFTLGLTEAWLSRDDRLAFPLCPGTIAGEFDERKHVFHNFTAAEIYEDFKLFVTSLRRVNPDVRILLTVSPVPLTATASKDHVMVASSYSKAVLRSIAGEFSSTYDFIDYFPSYELVAAHPMRAMFFEPNMRTVATEGVEIVMSHFFREHPPQKGAWREAKGGARVRKGKPPSPDEDDVVCEEMLLDQAL